MASPSAEAARLPIWEMRAELTEAITQNQVVIVAGETGSGKSTQLPKLCMELGLGTNGRIGHTQPRRIAARSIAERVADELETKVGGVVGYAVRFTDEVGPQTRLKLMTDGILLAEIQRDRELRNYDTLIIDEAHERSLNIDFLLGYLKQLLPRRPDLKLIVTSATIDTARFSDHFDGAPIIEVSGRSFPVEIGYRELSDQTLPEGIVDAVRELWRATDGDVLVFCSGERDIRDAAEALGSAELGDAEIFPLYARLSGAEQQRVFRAHKRRRVVLATNVAETSLTVPGIRSVVDPGLARISRYSARTKVQRLPIENISQASANQRAGRCGRVAPGVCLRLYAEDDFETRPEFTEPEIRRTNLASVILQMAFLGLGDIEQFPFVEAPDLRNIRDGVALLDELGAVSGSDIGSRKWLTHIGRKLARLPVDPRLGRMVLEAAELGCLHEVMVIVSGLSVQDPRERPADKREAANELHARFQSPSSDFLTYVALWDYLRDERRERSGNQFRKMCRSEFLNHNRIREWQDIYRQLRRVVDQLDLHQNRSPAAAELVHKSLLVGLLSQVGHKLPAKKAYGQKRAPRVSYAGPRNMQFVLAPGSPVTKNPPEWVMAAEIVETDQLRARTVTAVDTRWIEEVGQHLIEHSYTGAVWDPERGAAVVSERATLFGLPIVSGRRILLDRVNPEMARAMLIENALVDPEWSEHRPTSVQQFTKHAFIEDNDRLIATVRDIEARARRPDVLVDEESLFALYDARVPADVTTVKRFNSWWKKERPENPSRLNFELADLVRTSTDVDAEAYPDHWTILGTDLDLSYQFDPSSPIDGLTVDVPVELLGDLPTEPFTWNVPGFRSSLVEAHIRAMPKDLRRTFVPIPATVRSLVPDLDPTDGTLTDALRHALGKRAGVVIDPRHLSDRDVPGHLRPTFRVIDADGAMLVAGKDLNRLRQRLDDQTRVTLAEDSHEIEGSGFTTWPDLPDGVLPRTVDRTEAGHKITVFPALVDAGTSVAVRLFATEGEQQSSMWNATSRLLQMKVAVARRVVTDQLDNDSALALAGSPYSSPAAWTDDVVAAAIDEAISTAGGPAWDQRRFNVLVIWTRRKLPELLRTAGSSGAEMLILGQRINSLLAEPWPGAARNSIEDAKRHLGRLHYGGVLAAVGMPKHDPILRYLSGLEVRLVRLRENPGRDLALSQTCEQLEAEAASIARSESNESQREEIGWMLEEFRISVFAQLLGTEGRVSAERIRRAISAASGSL